jgi:hypothetical protein
MHLKIRFVMVVLTAMVVMAFSPMLSIKGQQTGHFVNHLFFIAQATLTVLIVIATYFVKFRKKHGG